MMEENVGRSSYQFVLSGNTKLMDTDNTNLWSVKPKNALKILI